jgi:hypothetical protein
MLSVVLGAMLIAAALLKLEGISSGALGQSLVGFSPAVQFAAIEAELLLGSWLLSGWARRQVWLISILFFLSLGGVSLYLGLIGQSSCNCFGRIHLNPWGSFGIDLLCVTALFLCRPLPHTSSLAEQSGWYREAALVATGAGAILAVVVGFVLLFAGNPANFLARLRGEQISVEPAVSSIGTGNPGETRLFTVRLVNHADKPIWIIGGTASCACVATDDLPVLIDPKNSKEVSVRVRFTGTPGMFWHQFAFDTEEQRVAVASFQGVVSASQRH